MQCRVKYQLVLLDPNPPKNFKLPILFSHKLYCASAQTNKSLHAFQISAHCKHSCVYLELRGPREDLLAFYILLKPSVSDDSTPSQTVKSIDADVCLIPHTTASRVSFACICSVIRNGVLQDNFAHPVRHHQSFCISFKSTHKHTH